MAKLNVNIGLSVNDKTGDTLRSAFDKINSNFTELYTLTGPAAQVQSDWTQSDNTQKDFIKNKPALFSGSYTDLTNKPTIPVAVFWPVTNTNGASGPTKVAIGASAGLTSQGTDTVAIGTFAGQTTQGNSAVAVGFQAGWTNQHEDATALGHVAGTFDQGLGAVAVGARSGYDTQGAWAVAIGAEAGKASQGANAVAIGRLAGHSSQSASTIILNATGSAVNGVAAQTDSFYVAPIRTDATPGNVLFYNTTTKEVTYGTAPSDSVSSLVNGSKTVSLASTGKLTLPAGTTYEYVNVPLTGHGDGLARLDFTLTTDGVVTQWWPASASPAGSGYSPGDTFTFDAEFLDIPGASVTIEVLTVGAGGSVENLAFTQPPLYPADIYRDSPVNLQVGAESNRWTFGANGTLTVPQPTSTPFTLTFAATNYVATGEKPTLTLTGDPWELHGQYAYASDGRSSLMLDDPFPILTNPGYATSDSFTFGADVHGIVGYTLTITLDNVVETGPAGWTSNVIASAAPAYPSTILTSGAIKLTNNNNSNWIFGIDGNLTLPAGGTINNTDGITLVTDRGTLVIGTQLETPGVAGHFHIAFDGNNSNPNANDLFLGDDYNYVKLPGYELNPADYGVEIGAHDRDGGDPHVWRFGTDGTTTFPNNSIKNSLGSNTAITTQRTLTANNTYTNGTDFSTDVDLGIGIGIIAGWYQGRATQIEFSLFGDYTFESYLTGLALGRIVIVTYNTSDGTSTLTGTLTQAFSGTWQTDSNNPTWSRVSGRIDAILPADQLGIVSINFPVYSTSTNDWTFGTDGKLTAPGNLEVDGGRIILNPYGNAYIESVDYGVNSSNSAVNIFGGPYQKIKLRAGFGTQATWTFGTDGKLTFPNATVQSTAYVAPTTGNSIIDSINPLTISRNGMTIRVTSAGMIQMSFNSVITITGRSSINNADSAVISSPNGATTSGTYYNIGAVLAAGDHLTATIVDSSFHQIYRLTAIIRGKGTTPGSEFATAYAIIEQLQ